MLLLVLRVYGLLLEPLVNLVARHYERQCDRYALARTAGRRPMSPPFRKVSRLNKDDPDPPRLEVILFHSHPPIAEAAFGMAAQRRRSARDGLSTTALGSRKNGDWLRGANHCGIGGNVAATVPVPFFPQPAHRWSVAKGDRHRRRRPYLQRQRDGGDGASPHLRLPGDAQHQARVWHP